MTDTIYMTLTLKFPSQLLTNDLEKQVILSYKLSNGILRFIIDILIVSDNSIKNIAIK